MVRMIQHVLAEIALAAIGARVGVVALNVAVLAAGDIFRRAVFDIIGAAERIVVIAIGIDQGRLALLEAAARSIGASSASAMRCAGMFSRILKSRFVEGFRV